MDDHSRPACAEGLPDEKAATRGGFLRRATDWFAQQGVTVGRILTDTPGPAARARPGKPPSRNSARPASSHAPHSTDTHPISRVNNPAGHYT
ncbi:hypothetical protein OG404_15180 [Streptomyces griseoaurantiacus]